MRIFSLLLKPLSWLYTLILLIRHWLFDRGFLYSQSFEQPIIKIGNLSFGGTGKTPMTIYLTNLLSSEKYNVYILSRGYGRNSRGIQEVLLDSTTDIIGDEPYLMKLKCPKARIFVAEDRVSGIHFINQLDASKKIILLDDALQHRRLNSGFQILLTEYSRPFHRDELFPAGKLRDITVRAKKADEIIITKSKDDKEVVSRLMKEIEEYTESIPLISYIKYLDIYDFFSKRILNDKARVIAITAIANDKYFFDTATKSLEVVQKISYKDHYRFEKKDIENWKGICDSHKTLNILMTEKDAVKLIPFQSIIESYQLKILVLPIEIFMNIEQQERLVHSIQRYINSFETRN